jgi:hypothetical protein
MTYGGRSRSIRRLALPAIAAIAVAVPAIASATIMRLPYRDYGAVTAKLAGVPGATVDFYALTKKLLKKGGKPINVSWSGIAGVPVTCTQGTIKLSNGGSFYTGTDNPVPVSASSAFTFPVPLYAYGYTGLTMTVAGQYSDHYKKVTGTVTLTESPSPQSLPAGTAGEYTGCTVASTPYTFAAKPAWRSEEY